MEVDENFLNAKALVVDNGSFLSKNGFAGEDRPRSVFPTIIGTHKYEPIMTDVIYYTRDHYIGVEALELKALLRLTSPIEHGDIKDWTDMEKIWHFTFYTDLRIDPSEHPILLTEAPLSSKPQREKKTEIMFEIFNVPALYFAIPAVLSLYASGRTTGCVVDIGAGVSHIIPIFEGYALKHLIKRFDFGGRDLDFFLQHRLRQKDFSVSTSEEKQIVRDIKETLCYVAIDPEKERMRFEHNIIGTKKTYLLPDDTSITIGEERFLTPECLLNPSHIGKEEDPLDEIIVKTISECDIGLRKELYNNIVLSGGSTLFPGIKERLTKEIKEKIPKSVDVKIIAPPDRIYSAWIGGSILASIKTFHRMWITKREYKEKGAQVVHRCF